jgi:type IV secretory pathway TrbD component
MAHEVPGYEIPFHGALSEPITLAGVPRTAAVLIGTLTAVLCLGLQAPWIGLPLGLGLYAAALWATQRDPYALEVLVRHLRQRTYLDA